jgi:hypothetical protein
MEWISIEERLPNKSDDYLVYYEKTYLPMSFSAKWRNICSFIEGKWLTDEDGSEVISHWMPLPEPPDSIPIINQNFKDIAMFQEINTMEEYCANPFDENEIHIAVYCRTTGCFIEYGTERRSENSFGRGVQRGVTFDLLEGGYYDTWIAQTIEKIKDLKKYNFKNCQMSQTCGVGFHGDCIPSGCVKVDALVERLDKR